MSFLKHEQAYIFNDSLPALWKCQLVACHQDTVATLWMGEGVLWNRDFDRFVDWERPRQMKSKSQLTISSSRSRRHVPPPRLDSQHPTMDIGTYWFNHGYCSFGFAHLTYLTYCTPIRREKWRGKRKAHQWRVQDVEEEFSISLRPCVDSCAGMAKSNVPVVSRHWKVRLYAVLIIIWLAENWYYLVCL